MLGKLLKYDLMTDYKTMSVLCIIMIVTSIALKILSSLFESVMNNITGEIIFIVLGTIFVLSIGLAFGVVFIMSIQRFYKNLVRDEGYLMHTLPVPTWQLILSKLLTVYAWYFAVIICLYICISIFIGDINWLFGNDIGKSITLGFSQGLNGDMNSANVLYNTFSLYMLITLFLSPFIFMATVYFSYSIGNLFNKSKLGMSVLTFIGIYVVEQIIGFIIVGISAASNPSIMNGSAGDLEGLNFMNTTMDLSFIISITISIALYICANVIFTKKLNLE